MCKSLILTVSAVLFPLNLFAQTIGFNVSGGNSDFGVHETPWSTGFAFTVTSTVTVDSLLLYDKNSDGLQRPGSIVVSILPDDGTTTPVSGLTATFDSSTATTFEGHSPVGGQWLENDVANTTLGPGDYTVMAQGILDQGFLDNVIHSATAMGAPGLVFSGPRAAQGIGNPATDPFGVPDGYFGPNFTVIPEPSTLILAVLGLLGLIIYGWRRRKQFG